MGGRRCPAVAALVRLSRVASGRWRIHAPAIGKYADQPVDAIAADERVADVVRGRPTPRSASRGCSLAGFVPRSHQRIRAFSSSRLLLGTTHPIRDHGHGFDGDLATFASFGDVPEHDLECPQHERGVAGEIARVRPEMENTPGTPDSLQTAADLGETGSRRHGTPYAVMRNQRGGCRDVPEPGKAFLGTRRVRSHGKRMIQHVTGSS